MHSYEYSFTKVLVLILVGESIRTCTQRLLVCSERLERAPGVGERVEHVLQLRALRVAACAPLLQVPAQTQRRVVRRIARVDLRLRPLRTQTTHCAATSAQYSAVIHRQTLRVVSVQQRSDADCS